MKEFGAKIGIATDGDADRFGIVDETAPSSQPNYIIALLFDYLVKRAAGRTASPNRVATTNLINALAEDARRAAVRDAGRLQVHRRTHHRTTRSPSAAKSAPA